MKGILHSFFLSSSSSSSSSSVSFYSNVCCFLYHVVSNDVVISEQLILKDLSVSHRVIFLKGLWKPTEDVRVVRIRS